MTGYRVRWTRCSPVLAAQLTKMQESIVSCAGTFNQAGAVAALTGPQDCVRDMREHYKRRRDVALSILKQRGRPSTYCPGGAFYLPVDISSGRKSDKLFALSLSTLHLPFNYSLVLVSIPGMRYTGLRSREFALRLLQEKRCALAPGIAFNTFDPIVSGSTLVSHTELQRRRRRMLRLG